MGEKKSNLIKGVAKKVATAASIGSAMISLTTSDPIQDSPDRYAKMMSASQVEQRERYLSSSAALNQAPKASGK